MAGCTAPGDAPASGQGSSPTTTAAPIAGATSSQPMLRVAAATPAGPATIRLDKGLVQQALRQGELMVELPDGTRYPVAMEREQAEIAGRTTFIGKVRTPFGLQSAVLTFGPDAVFGVLPKPDGHALSVVTMHGRVQIAPAGGMAPRGVRLPTAMRDFVASPPPPTAAATGTSPGGEAQPMPLDAMDAPLEPVRIDVLGLYDMALVKLRGSEAAALTEVISQVAIANQVHVDSGTRVTLSLSALRGIAVPEGVDNTGLLYMAADNLVEGVDIHGMRDENSADLVAIVRPYIEGDPTCGIAFLTAAYQGRDYVSPDWAYSVSSVDPCGPYVFAHETAHSMGSTHDIETSSWTIDRLPVYGAYPFSFGYRQDGPPAFATVMAYQQQRPWVGYFSNPASDACGAACGVDRRADNVRSINLMAERIAGFRGQPGTVSILDGEGFESIAGDVSGLLLAIRATPPLPAEGVRLKVAVVSDSGTAAVDVDYLSQPPREENIDPGYRETFTAVFVVGDDEVEGDETVDVQIIESNMPIDRGRATATIVDDDPRPVLTGRVVFPEGHEPPSVAFPIDVRGVASTYTHETIEVAPPDFSYAITYLPGANISLNAFPPAPFAAKQFDLGQLDEGLVQDYPMVPGVTVRGRLRLREVGPAPQFPLMLRFTESIESYGRPDRYLQLDSLGQEFSFQIVPDAWFSLRVDDASPYQPFLVAGSTSEDVVHDVTLASLPTVILAGPRNLSNEGPAYMTAWVELSAPAPEGGVSLSYRTEAGTAAPFQDFEPVSGELYFAPGESVQSFPVTLHGDELIEEDETFDLVIENIVGALAPIPRVTVVIPNDDYVKPKVSLRADPPAFEGAAGVVNSFGVTVELSQPTEGVVSLVYRTSDGTARAGEDYEPVEGTLVFAPGETVKTVALQTNGDDVRERNESFDFVIDEVQNAIPMAFWLRIAVPNDD